MFTRARENARRKTCQENLRQIGPALLQYTRDWNQKLPRADNGVPGHEVWAESLRKYVKDTKVFVCPQDYSPFDLPNGLKVSYALNQLYANNPALNLFAVQGRRIHPASLSSIKDVPGTIALGDGAESYQVRPTGNATSLKLVLDDDNSSFGDGGPNGKFSGRHLNGANFLFLDGHVKWMKLNKAATRDKTGKYVMFTPTLDYKFGN